MKLTMMTGLMAALVMAVGVAVTDANATVLDLGHPTETPFITDGVGNMDRSLVIDATSTFSITSAGIRFDPLDGGATDINVEIYSVDLTGGVGTRGNLLATSATSITDVGMDFYDIAINYTFQAGNRYDIAFNSIAALNWASSNNMEFYNFDYPDTPYNVGSVLNVIDGGLGGGYTNFVIPHVRLNAVDQQQDVPEPAALAIFGLGLLGLGLAAQRRKNKI